MQGGGEVSIHSGKRHIHKAQKHRSRNRGDWFRAKHGETFKEPTRDVSSVEEDFAELEKRVLGKEAKK